MRSVRIMGLAAGSLVAAWAGCSPSGNRSGTSSEAPAPASGNADAPSGNGSSSPGAGVETTDGRLPCEVGQLFAQRCGTCHADPPAFGASVPLTSVGDLTKAGPGGAKVHDLVAARVRDDARPMPPAPNARLTDAELKILESWKNAGYPAGTEECAKAEGPAAAKPLPCKPDVTVKAPKPYTLPANGEVDQYVCFGFDVSLTKKRHVTALGPRIDNRTVLHHILLFQTDEAVGPDPVPCEAFGSANWRLVAGWAPGGENTILPPEAGFPEEAGTTHWVMQLHYNNARNLPNQTDQSGYDLCTTETLRPNDAGLLGFGSVRIDLPARSKQRVTCNYTLPQSFRGVSFFSASPHMHKLGRAMATYRVRGNGTPEKVIDTPFRFEDQVAYPVSMKVAPGDVLRTSCTYENTSDARVGFGEGTGDEMCFDFIAYYPKIPDQNVLGLPLFSWVTPSLNAQCTTEAVP